MHNKIFASCECLRLKLDPFKTPLVVANEAQGSGAITLAVTPYLKKLGVPSRGRLYEIPKHISYKIRDFSHKTDVLCVYV